jgi:biopolymer transport protein ExbB
MYAALRAWGSNNWTITRKVSVLELFLAGGILMWPLLACSLIVIAISAERYWTLNPGKIAPKTLLAQVWSWIKNNQLDATRLRELKQSSPLGQILAAGLSNSKHGREVMKDSIQEAANQVIHELERYMNVLGTIATIAPLIGLLGTVLGMIEVFNAIMMQGTGSTGALAGGISVALYTTVGGLVVAIPATVSHRFFQRRIDSIVVTMEDEAIKLVDALHSDRRVDVKVV